jgi:hypothetical protein
MELQPKRLNFITLRGNTAAVLTTYIMSVLHTYRITNKMIAFCGDKCNTDFGGAARERRKSAIAKPATT